MYVSVALRAMLQESVLLKEERDDDYGFEGKHTRGGAMD